jgi:alpha-glucosidase (family GH31 glycosyl hydrolase)
MAAPILYHATVDRNVYFPKHKWYDFHSGNVYEKGNHTLKNITLTSKVPLFLAEGSVVLTQNTTNVTKTRELGNTFGLLAGLHLESKSDASMISSANGSIMSIQNYNDEAKLVSCISQGCQYLFSLSFIENSNSKQLEISCIYNGGSNLN